MWESFLTAVDAVIPFSCYLLLGVFARYALNVEKVFLERLNQLIFKLMFPFMVFYNIYQGGRTSALSVRLLIFTGCGILLLQASLLLIIPRLVRENSRRGVIIQAIYRSNFVLFGLPLTGTLFGPESAGAAAMLVTLVLTLYNITSVIILELYNGSTRTTFRELLIKLCQNPMLQGCALGLLFFFRGIRLPAPLVDPVSSFASMTTPLAMFTLGGTLRFREIRKNLKYIIPTLLAKLIFVPLIFVLFAYITGMRTLELFLVLAVFGTPVASGSYPMAVNMGGDGELAGQLVFTSTVASILTLFFWIFCMGMLKLY